jgi:hypothetical protein
MVPANSLYPLAYFVLFQRLYDLRFGKSGVLIDQMLKVN